jgi:hypothetical protein
MTLSLASLRGDVDFVDGLFTVIEIHCDLSTICRSEFPDVDSRGSLVADVDGLLAAQHGADRSM